MKIAKPQPRKKADRRGSVQVRVNLRLTNGHFASDNVSRSVTLHDAKVSEVFRIIVTAVEAAIIAEESNGTETAGS